MSLTLKRHVSNAELSTILRPFYFAVHPDLFGQHPEQRVNNHSVLIVDANHNEFEQKNLLSFQSTNEESLKHLSAYIESMQKQRTHASSPKILSFYIRDSESRGEKNHVDVPQKLAIN